VWIGYRANRAHQQRRALEFIRTLDEGYVGYDRRPDDLRVPEWFRQFAGDDFFVSVTEIHLCRGITSDQLPAVVDHLRRLPKLRTVYLWDAQVTDDDFGHLRRLTQISRLGLHFPWQDVTGSGLRHVASMRNVRELMVSGHSINNDGLQYVAEFPALERFSIGWNGVDDHGLVHLARCPKLKHLTLSGCRCGDRGLRAITQIETLESLNFLNMEFVALFNVPVQQNETVVTLTDQDFTSLVSGTGLSENGFDKQSTKYESLKSWLVARRPGLSVTWCYEDP